MEIARTDLAVEARDEYMEKYARKHEGEADGITFGERTERGVKIQSTLHPPVHVVPPPIPHVL